MSSTDDAAQPAEPSAAPAPTPAAMPGRITPKAMPKAAKAPAAALGPSASASFGRADESGTVFVTDGDSEREVGSYPGATPDEAVQYFARKYDELFAHVSLLASRVAQPEVSAREVAEGLKQLKGQTEEPLVVGDLAALRAALTSIEEHLVEKRAAEDAHRAVAKAAALAEREKLVLQAEELAATPPERISWKSATSTMRSLVDQWKSQQKSGARLDKNVENDLWQRLSRSRNSFDKARKSHFAGVENQRSAAKGTKEELVAQAEELASSTDWGSTAGKFKALMQQWRQAGHAGKAEDDALWARFKAAQDAFFAAKDEVNAAQDEEFAANLKVKEEILAQAQALLPISDLAAAKSSMRSLAEKWEAAGKVPRQDVRRMEGGMRAVEDALRQHEDKTWKSSNPELSARAQSMVDQLEAKIASLESDLTAAKESGDAKAEAAAQEALTAQRAWLTQVSGGLAEFGR